MASSRVKPSSVIFAIESCDHRDDGPDAGRLGVADDDDDAAAGALLEPLNP